jgi:hypothetical protein
MNPRWMRGGAALTLVVLLSGCSGQGNISGTVKIGTQPVAGGTITFYDSRNGTVSSPIADDGSYSVSRVAVGPVKVSVAVPMPIAFSASSMPGSKPVRPTIKTPAIPAKYQNPEESGLGFQVVKGSQVKDFDLSQ